jgi:hypothetical protein
VRMHVHKQAFSEIHCGPEDHKQPCTDNADAPSHKYVLLHRHACSAPFPIGEQLIVAGACGP